MVPAPRVSTARQVKLVWITGACDDVRRQWHVRWHAGLGANRNTSDGWPALAGCPANGGGFGDRDLRNGPVPKFLALVGKRNARPQDQRFVRSQPQSAVFGLWLIDPGGGDRLGQPAGLARLAILSRSRLFRDTYGRRTPHAGVRTVLPGLLCAGATFHGMLKKQQ